MPEPAALDAYEYAYLRVVPHVPRGDFVTAGVILFCRPQDFLEVRLTLDDAALGALYPDCDVAAIRRHLDQIPRIGAGDPAAGPIAALPPAERFRWLVAPRSTVIQTSPVHAGLAADPAEALARLVRELEGTARHGS